MSTIDAYDTALAEMLGPATFGKLFANVPTPADPLTTYVARRTDTLAAQLGRTDKEVAYALGDVACTPALLLAVRTGDEGEIGRMVLAGVRHALRAKAASLAEAEFMDREAAA